MDKTVESLSGLPCTSFRKLLGHVNHSLLQPVCLVTRDPRISTPSSVVVSKICRVSSAFAVSLCGCDADRFSLSPIPSRIFLNLSHVFYGLCFMHRHYRRTVWITRIAWPLQTDTSDNTTFGQKRGRSSAFIYRPWKMQIR